MAMLCDGVVANLTSLYLGVILFIKLFGLMIGSSFSGWFVAGVSTFVVGCIFVGALAWDISSKAMSAYNGGYYQVGGSGTGKGGAERCRGGICWHGVSVNSTVSQFRLQLPQHTLATTHQHRH